MMPIIDRIEKETKKQTWSKQTNYFVIAIIEKYDDWYDALIRSAELPLDESSSKSSETCQWQERNIRRDGETAEAATIFSLRHLIVVVCCQRHRDDDGDSWHDESGTGGGTAAAAFTGLRILLQVLSYNRTRRRKKGKNLSDIFLMLFVYLFGCGREEKEESGRHIGQLLLARFLDVLQIELRLDDGEAAQRIDDETQVKMAASAATGAPIQRSPRQTITDDNDLPTNENRPPRYSPHAGFMFYSFPFLSFTLPFGGHLKLFGQDLIWFGSFNLIYLYLID